MNLLNMLITSGNQLASIAEIFVGKMPGQNTPATTTQETVKQGMAVFTAIYKRVYRSLMAEFKKIHRLNRIVPGIVEEDAKKLKMDLIADDYDDDNLIIPGGDPTGDSETTKMSKVQQVGGLLQLGTIDPMAYTKWSLKAMEIPDYESLLPPPPQGPPPPSPEEQAMQAELQMKQKESDIKIQEKQADIQHKETLASIKAQELSAKTEATRTSQAMDLQGQRAKIQHDTISKVTDQRHKERMAQTEFAKAQADAALTLQQKEQLHQQKMRQDRSKPKNGTKQK
jgi:hypothetical protein